MESSLHLRAICYTLQNISLCPVWVATVFRIILLKYFLVRQYIFVTRQLEGELKHLRCNRKRIIESSLHLCCNCVFE